MMLQLDTMGQIERFAELAQDFVPEVSRGEIEWILQERGIEGLIEKQDELGLGKLFKAFDCMNRLGEENQGDATPRNDAGGRHVSNGWHGRIVWYKRENRGGTGGGE